MSEQALDLRRSVQIVRRHRILVGIVASVGLLGGAAYTAVHPPMLQSKALVVLPSSIRTMSTQVVIAGSNPVLASALPNIDPALSLPTLRSRVQVKSLTPNILSISAEGQTGAQAEHTANAIADSYITYVGSANSPGGQVQAQVLESATSATGTPLPVHLLIAGGVGALAGALIGAIIALAISRNDRRLRERDAIADSIGVPVLASIPVAHPSGSAGWTKLLADYEPGVVDAWRLRKALHHLRVAEANPAGPGEGSNFSIAVLSLSSDRGALAVGPQLSVFAASLGIRTALVIGPQQDANATATLRAACAVPPQAPSGRASGLQVITADHGGTDRPPDGRPDGRPDATLTVAVAVVDGQTPRTAEVMRTTTTVLAVSAGAATAEQLARVAISAAADGRQIAGIFVADPDSADHTTGRLPQLARPARRRMPTRMTGPITEIRR